MKKHANQCDGWCSLTWTSDSMFSLMDEVANWRMSRRWQSESWERRQSGALSCQTETAGHDHKMLSIQQNKILGGLEFHWLDCNVNANQTGELDVRSSWAGVCPLYRSMYLCIFLAYISFYVLYFHRREYRGGVSQIFHSIPFCQLLQFAGNMMVIFLQPHHRTTYQLSII